VTRAAPPPSTDPILDALRRHWGYDALRPLQREAIEAGIRGRDSLVVMPTGGGKSLCYQIPPLVTGRLDLVVSPLVALMKDQVDALRANDYPAAALHSGLDEAERSQSMGFLRSARCRLLFVSPERLVLPGFLELVAQWSVRSFAIDEAHCISHWGHDFRPEYRQLAALRQRFPEASLHAFTATATPRVRQDIVDQLRLRDPVRLVGDFDRPNLIYRILPKVSARTQVRDVLARHPGEAAIVYCLSRRDTEEMAESLRESKIKAEHYHAGMSADARRRTHDRFADEAIDVVVATVAFGMGIDRGNVRCVVHAALPKSVEAYQQETGRAGRDGLPAECVLLYSYADVAKWEDLMAKSCAEAVAADPSRQEEIEAHLAGQLGHLRELARVAGGARCRHAALCEHFGQPFLKPACGACDVCLAEIDSVPESTTVARKILSAVARTGQRFGAAHIAKVLTASEDEAVLRLGHERLSVYGLLGERRGPAVINLIHQLVDHGLLLRREGEFPTLQITASGMDVMRGAREVLLREPVAKKKAKRTAQEASSWSGVDRDLFDRLRDLRRRLAIERGVPPYMIFGDETLRELARLRPRTLEEMATVRGVGRRKLEDFGEVFLAVVLAAGPESPGGGASRGAGQRHPKEAWEG
jgi:ATP-dependent DNA helicase RecQ